MKVPALALSLTVGASVIGPAVPARAGVISNLLGTAAETVQPGTGGVVRIGWGLLRGVGRAVIPRRRRRRPAPPPTTSPQAEDREAVPGGSRVLAESPRQGVAVKGELTLEDLLVDPPAPPGAAVPQQLSEQP